ncbi:hypothetical protein K9U39_13785 [Rhodoblastus acidophilus]|uniref:Uncharacterized protein n=1 Tax=Candidatus Rhodoblastus alkanivorans TaxID=2954117 RepID=A0ABS9ZAL0_9HYPH|nr:hypothetical protein [Candidatus Rhodoblastus alkanivorans]MCI4677823.1 hypothetical protein [Candidatus Rhodoblastus alkanivorans]MCI4684679.1 hypothetical protein [Candidatus Rhodoblastus alkanivorans]MDI4642001.1 hypothetical protein [Rhodoblastus acidophilus]
MRTTELFRTCANEHVAAAALACIGGKFERRVAVAARRAGLSVGAFVAGVVADFDRKASPLRRKSLEMGMVQSDMPILAGLRHVVETAFDDSWDAALKSARDFSPAPASAGVHEFTGLRWNGRSPGALRPREAALKSLVN